MTLKNSILVVLACGIGTALFSDAGFSAEKVRAANSGSTQQVKLPLSDKSSGGLFEELAPEKSGVEFQHRLLPEHTLAYLYHSGYQCGGVSLGDVNRDGRPDIFLVSGPDENALFVNQGDMKFAKSPATEQLADGDAWGTGATLVDINGDGAVDVFVCNYGTSNRLWLNEGVDSNGVPQFRECAHPAGLTYRGPSLCPYFADFDNDGDLDLFLLTNRLYSPYGRPKLAASELGPDGRPQVKNEYAKYLRVVEPEVEVPGGDGTPEKFLLEYGYEDRLYRNDGVSADGTPQFVDVTTSSALHNVVGHGLSALIWDINRDHLPDIYVANDYSDPDRLWINKGTDENGVFQFEDATDDYLPYTTWFSMGSDVGDVNGDGYLDFMVADMSATTHFKAKTTMGEMSGWRRWVLENAWPRQVMRNMLFINTGTQRFRETAYIAGVASSDWTWAVRFADLDLDGRNDVFLSNGTARVFSDSDVLITPEMMVGQTEWDIFKDKPAMREQNLAFRNLDGQQFEDASDAWNLGKVGMSFGSALGDLDGDGDLDLVVCNLEENVSLYRNQAADRGGNWLRIRLEESNQSLNRAAFGAKVIVSLSSGDQLVRLMNPQRGFLSTDEAILHFGLGDQASVKEITVHWPDGSTQRMGPQSANQLLTIRRSSTVEAAAHEEVPATLFAERAAELGLTFKHHEEPFDDFKREFLLPGKLSQFGPGIAVADINGDDVDDMAIAGGAGQPTALFVSRRQSDGSVQFTPLEDVAWQQDAATEDMGMLFFDADRDGDLDLYIARGSNQWDPGDSHYRDGLFINNPDPGGNPRFVAAPKNAFPDVRESSSCVVGADFDRDGDVDLFVGARSVPGRYPLTPTSTLLRNDSTKPGEINFANVTEDVAPNLAEAGLVTGALWSDVNGDGWVDLLVTCEWGLVRLFINREGKLKEATQRTALSKKTGWWNGITGTDIDGDGDTDYVVTNVGLNTKYGHATKKKPAVLYLGDMDENGKFDLIEAKTTAEGELPVRGRSCSCNAMPLLRERFPTYKQFAAASLQDIYTPTMLGTSQKREATEFRSGIWVNESTEESLDFRWMPLPFDVQVSPGYGVVAQDLFGDGLPALAMTQNLFSREPETSLWRGGLGAIVRFNGSDGHDMSTVRVRDSGFLVEGDGKGLVVTDVNGDGRPDLLATQNNAELKAFVQQENSAKPEAFAVKLRGLPGNPQALGAKVSLIVEGQQVAGGEIYGGSGYLSQSTATIFFKRPPENGATVSVTWPEGQIISVDVSMKDSVLVVSHPSLE